MLIKTVTCPKKEVYLMTTQITAKKMQLSPSFSEYAEERLSSKLDKFFGSEANAKITLSTIKNKIILELTVTYNGLMFRAEQSAEDKNDALDACIDKIIRQIRKNKTKLSSSFVTAPLRISSRTLPTSRLTTPLSSASSSTFVLCPLTRLFSR